VLYRSILICCFSVCLNLKADIVNPIIDPELPRFTSSLGLPFNKKIFVISAIYAKTSIEPETDTLTGNSTDGGGHNLYTYFGSEFFSMQVNFSDVDLVEENADGVVVSKGELTDGEIYLGFDILPFLGLSLELSESDIRVRSNNVTAQSIESIFGVGLTASIEDFIYFGIGVRERDYNDSFAGQSGRILAMGTQTLGDTEINLFSGEISYSTYSASDGGIFPASAFLPEETSLDFNMQYAVAEYFFRVDFNKSVLDYAKNGDKSKVWKSADTTWVFEVDYQFFDFYIRPGYSTEKSSISKSSVYNGEVSRSKAFLLSLGYRFNDIAFALSVVKGKTKYFNVSPTAVFNDFTFAARLSVGF